MLDLMICEFQKLKRKKFIIFATLAAFLFPIPMTAFAIRQHWNYEELFNIILGFGHFVLLIPVLCIVETMLLFMERDNSTMKNLLTIPISRTKIIIIKLLILLIVSVLYAVTAMIASLMGAAIVGVSVSNVLQKLLLSVVVGIMTMIASLPCVTLIVWCNKNNIISLIISFLYTIIGFIIGIDPKGAPGLNLSTLLPVGMISRWMMPYLNSNHLDVNTRRIIFVSTPLCFIFLGVVAVICMFFIAQKYQRQEN
ncbi:ABC transporter permease [Haloimpatiens sp. FM7330]|uniref:ABC transporter permease n=1 Tax=Haloimpatiens sp. FM7330 TaxID=3298610 RepID=UPI00363018DA